MKPSRTFLSSVIFLSMGSPLVHAAGTITIGGSPDNITSGPIFSPVTAGQDATVSEFDLVNALNANPLVTVTNAANVAGTGIKVANAIVWTGVSTLKLDAHDGINIAAGISNTLGGNLELTANQGSVALNGLVRLTGSSATSNLLVNATAGVTQNNLHILNVQGLATFNAGTSNITLTGPTNDFGSLNLTGNVVSVREASATHLAGVSANALGITSGGAITQSGSVQVAGLATFDAGLQAITLGHSSNNFGSLSLTGGAISISEAGSTDLATVSATSLSVTSGGALANSGNVNVTGAATLAGASIDLGGAAGTVSVGSLNVNSVGNVTLRLASGTSLTGANTAGHLAWNTQGIATLALGSTITAGTVEIRAGQMNLSGNNQIIANNAIVGTGTKLELGAFNNSVGTYTQNGSAILAGSGTLSASIYNLNGGTVNANLGTGTLNHIGNSTLLNGLSAASLLNISGGTLSLGAANRIADSASLVVSGGVLDLAGFNETVDVFALNTGSINGISSLTASRYDLSGGTVNANLGLGTLNQLANNSVLNGISSAAVVNVNGGTLTLGAADRLANNAALTLNGGSLALGSFNETVGTVTVQGGSLDGSGTLNASSYNLKGGTVNAKLGAGVLTQSSGSTLLNGTSASASITVSGGTLTLGAADRLTDTSVVSITGGTLNLASHNETVGTFNLTTGTLDGTGTLTAATYSLNGGTVNANLGAGILNQLSSTTLLNGTSASNTIAINGGTLALGASDRLADSAAVTIASAGTLDLGNFNDSVASFVLNGGNLDGSGTLTTSIYALNGGIVNANLGAGTLNQLSNATVLNGSSAAALVNVNAGTLTLGTSDRLADTSTVTIASTGTLNLGNSDDTVGSFVLNSGTLNGTGTLTAATYDLNGGTVNGNLGAGVLNQLANLTTLNGSSSAATVNINAGTLRLGASDRLSNSAHVTLNSAILNLGSFTDTITKLTLNAGTLNGTGTLTATTYDLNGGTVNANLGSGTLNQLSNTTTLNGTSATETIHVLGGTLALGSSDRLVDTATMNVASTLNLGNFNDTIGNLVLNSGTLNGTGTLTATTYDLNGGTLNANLGAGTLNQLSNTTLLNGISAAGSVNINGGTLTLGSSDRLANNAAVIVNSAILNLDSFSDSVGSFALNGGSLNGSGTLTAATYDLNGGTVNANLGAGTLNQIGNTTLLNGSSAASAVNVNGGTLTLGAADRLANNAALVIGSGTLDLTSFSDSVGTFTLNGGTLAGSGTLTASTYSLNGGTVNANLGSGTLEQLSNTTILNGTSAATTVAVNGGTLTLGASNRLSDSAALTVAGTLDLGNFNDSVATLALNGGTINGTGTLTAATYDLNGGSVNAKLGLGTLNQLSNTTTLNGTSAAATVNINGGTLALGASNRLADNAAVAIANNATLDLGTSDDTVGSFVLNGGTLAGTGTLTTAIYALNGGTVNANLGQGTLSQLANTTVLNGTSAADIVTINGGTLALGAANRLSNSAALSIASTGTLNLGTFNDTVGSLVLNGGTLNGTGTLTATTYGLNGGTLNANLGAGTLNQLSNTTVLNGTSAATSVNINGGILSLGASDRLSDGATVTVAGVLNIGNFSDLISTLTLNGGTVNGSGTLTAISYVLNGGTVNANLGTGSLNQISGNTLLNGSSAASGVTVSGGTLTLGASDRLADSAALFVHASSVLDLTSFSETVDTVTLVGGTINGSGTLTAASYVLYGGTVNANLGSGELNQFTNTTVLNGTSAAGTVNVVGGTLSLGASDRLTDTAVLTVASTLNLGNFNDTVGRLVLNNGTLNGTGTLTALIYDLYGGSVNANLGLGTLNQVSNITTLNGSASAGVVNVNGGTLALGASDRLSNSAAVTVNAATFNLGTFSDTVGSFALNGGTLNGSGTLTAATYALSGGTLNANLGAGTLNQLSNITVLNGSSAAATVNVNGGTLTLGASDRLSNSAAVTIASTGTLNLGTFNDSVGSLILNGGTLAGTGTLTASTYALSGGSVNANLGTGTLNQLSNTTTLNGTSAAGTVNINGGTLVFGASNRLADNAAVAIASGGTLDLGNFNDSVGTLALNGGSLNGTGTLTASTYALNGGSVNANLGTGTLNQLSNTTTLNGSSAATTVNVNGGTLALGASNRLADSAALTIASSGTFNLGAFSETVGSLVLNGGNIDGTGTLTATTYGLNGGTVNANLGTGTLNQLSNTTVLNGTSAASIVNVNGGTLSLGASDRLADNAAVTIAGTLNLGNFNDTIGSLTLVGGTINGTGILTASAYSLSGNTMNANLGAGTLNQVTGNSILNGTSAAGTVNVNGGTLTLGASDRLAEDAALTVNAATFDLDAFSDRVGTFTLNGGTLNGSGTLAAATYDLNGGTVNANLEQGTLNQLTNTTVLNGASAALTVNVAGGTLTLGASDRLANRAILNVTSTLNLGNFNDTVFDLVLNGGTVAGTGTLTANNYLLNGGTVNGNLGEGALDQLSNTTVLNGTSAANSVTINGGTLALGASERLSNTAFVTFNTGSLNLGSFDETVGNVLLNGGTLNGTGTLTADIYDLNAGTVNANLGSGTLNAKGGVLNGRSAAETVMISGNGLTLGASERLADTAALTVSGSLHLGNFNETVSLFILNNGTLEGTGTLNAASYSLAGGQVNANLGSGTLNQVSGLTGLLGASSAATVNITGGSLRLDAAHRLANNAALTIATTASLDLGNFNDRVDSLTLNGGTLDGTGTLTAATYDLVGGTVNANLGSGTLNHLSGTTTLNGISDADTLDLSGGTLVLGASDRLADTANLALSGTLDLASFNEKVAKLTLNGGTLDGSGTLTAARYQLNGGAVNANLGSGILSQLDETTTLNGTTAASRIFITGGTLVLGSSDRFADSATVTVGSDGRLDLAATTDTVGILNLNGGRLAGSGTLTAATYNLNGGVVDANLGDGSLNQLSHTTTLNGRSATDLVTVRGGILTLGSSNRLSDNAAVAVNSAELNLGTSSDTVRSLTMDSAALVGSGTLTARFYRLDDASVIANLGTGSIEQIGGFSRLKGSSSAAKVKISGGVLKLMAAERLSNRATVRVENSGKLQLRAANETVTNYFQADSGKLVGNGNLNVTGLAKLSGGTIAGNLTGNMLTTGDVTVTGNVGGGFVRVKDGNFTLKGSLASDTNIGGNGSFLGAGKIDGSLKNDGLLAVGSLKKSLNVTGNFTNQGTITLSLKDFAKFESIKADTMKFGGTLVVVNDGSGLRKRQEAQLFKAGSYTGEFDSVVTVGFRNKLVFDATTGTLTGTGKLSQSKGKSKAALLLTAAASTPTHPVKGVRVIGGLKFRTLTISRTPGVDISSGDIEVSSDRLDWSSGKQHLTVLRDDATALVVRDNTPVHQDNKRFIRLKH
ncbi:MAG: hypothetical protein V4640_02690 [Verrucomicrobiota bacterium]